MDNIRFRKIEINPSLDVDCVSLRIEETDCNIKSYGVVYDIFVGEQSTSLTIEELIVIRNHINYLIELRDKSPERQGCK